MSTMSLFGDALDVTPVTSSSAFLGHHDIVERLSNAFEHNTIPHALLLTGLKGVGKHQLSLYLSHFLLHQNASSFQDLCHDTLLTSHILESIPDFLRISPEKNTISTDQIRSINAFCNLTPVQFDKKVVIIDECDSMTKNASNAFLKTLEEAPGHAFFILIAQHYQTLDDTILSRCIHVHLPMLDQDDIIAYLHREESKLWDQTSPALQEVILFFASGSIGKAVRLLHTCNEDFFKELLQGMMTFFYRENNHNITQSKENFKNFLTVHSHDFYDIISHIIPLFFIFCVKKYLLQDCFPLPSLMQHVFRLIEEMYQDNMSLLIKRCFFFYERISLLLKYAEPPAHMKKEDIILQILTIDFL